MGKIITFYSYKGGTGRSMALANVAYFLSSWGYKTLIVDWDLEAPGLHNFYCKYVLSENLEGPGVVDMLSQLQENNLNTSESYINWEQYIKEIILEDNKGKIYYLPAGENNSEYYEKVRNLDINGLYSKHNCGAAIEHLRDIWKTRYDYVLIDSRTGITDIGGICTVQLPDILALLFTATKQSLNGAVDVAERANNAQKKLLADRMRLNIVPIASRFDSREEFKISLEWNARFAQELEPIYRNWLPTSIKSKDMIEVTRIPYSTYFSFGEKLAAVEQSRKDSGGLSYSYENIAALLGNELENVEMLVEDRDRYVARASSIRKHKNLRKKIFISYSHKDKNILKKLMSHLVVLERFGNFSVWSDEQIGAGHEWYSQIKEEINNSSVVVMLISADYLSSKFIMRRELPSILERELESNLKVVPIIVRPCAWMQIPYISELQVYPINGQPLSNLARNELDEALAQLTEEIARLSDMHNDIDIHYTLNEKRYKKVQIEPFIIFNSSKKAPPQRKKVIKKKKKVNKKNI